ncbi:MAG: DUF4330 domain-containing protein [Candidatus Gastranaerophilales bacterium]|nr:DUF4330 domain-containing protein [Candidatus Gastranaerophilales bacterium]
MIKDGKIFGKFNILDLSIIVVILLTITGLLLVKTGKFTTSSKIIKKEAMIEFDVVLRGVKLSNDKMIFKTGNKSFITIRNVPYTSLGIINVIKTSQQTVLPNPVNPSKAISVNDPSEPYTYNFTVTLKDKALITNDGPVIGGNKIKIGLIVTLEGADYRLNGLVSGLRVLK